MCMCHVVCDKCGRDITSHEQEEEANFCNPLHYHLLLREVGRPLRVRYLILAVLFKP